MQLRFVTSESAFDYFRTTRAYLEEHGKPVAFYSDKHGIFRVNRKDAAGGYGVTQFAIGAEHRHHLCRQPAGEGTHRTRVWHVAGCKSANTSPPSTRARARARGAAGNQRPPWPADKVERRWAPARPRPSHRSRIARAVAAILDDPALADRAADPIREPSVNACARPRARGCRKSKTTVAGGQGAHGHTQPDPALRPNDAAAADSRLLSTIAPGCTVWILSNTLKPSGAPLN
jgi:hypothetical protein